MIARADLERDVVVVACAISAGVHGALTPMHFEEGLGAGTGFLMSTALLAGLVVALTRSASLAPLVITALVLSGLIGSYALAITSGVPVLHPAPEPVDGLAVATKLVEAVGLVFALDLLRRSRPAVAALHLQPKGTTR